ncbi:MAG: hypothetical protein AMXMBFR58_27710 [Phycisphaerae bacterium]
MDALRPARYTLPPVSRRTSAYPLSMFARLMRSDAMRWLAVVVLAPMMAMGTLGGAQFLSHGHDDHGTHLHPVGPLKGAELAAADHADDHGHDHAVSASDSPAPCDGDEDGLPGEVPEGVIVSIDVHKQLPTRGTDLSKSLLPAVMFVIAVFVVPPSPELDGHVGSPGGAGGGGPLDLVALSASDRLVRTSRALLI